MKKFNFVLPSLKISGGIKQALKLAEELEKLGCDSPLFVMWVSPNEVQVSNKRTYLSKFSTTASLAIFELPIIFIAFLRRYLLTLRADASGAANNRWVFTHYTTLPLALIIPRNQLIFFVQGLEWHFVRNRLISNILKRFILYVYSKGTVLTANHYLTETLTSVGVDVKGELPIWADERFLVAHNEIRTIDLVMVLRKGDTKRLDLYLEFITLCNTEHSQWKLAVVTPDMEIEGLVRRNVHECHLKPSIETMASVYARSKYFLMLSDHEGFGLPPLEAMGAGCVPICRKSGGPRAYIRGDLEEIEMPLDWDAKKIVNFALDVDNRNRWKHYSTLSRHIFEDGLALAKSRAATLAQLA